jgi:hypothetical protein
MHNLIRNTSKSECLLDCPLNNIRSLSLSSNRGGKEIIKHFSRDISLITFDILMTLPLMARLFRSLGDMPVLAHTNLSLREEERLKTRTNFSNSSNKSYAFALIIVIYEHHDRLRCEYVMFFNLLSNAAVKGFFKSNYFTSRVFILLLN